MQIPTSIEGSEEKASGVLNESPTDYSDQFDAATVEKRIRELEAEIQAEIARMKSPETAPNAGSIQPEIQAVPPNAPNSAEVVEDKVEVEDNTNITEEKEIKLQEQEKQRNEALAMAAAAEAQAQQQKFDVIEKKVKPLKDKATGVTFDAKLEDGLYLVGVGVRKKAIINVYAVALYSGPSTLECLSPFPRGKQKREAQKAMQNAARTFGPTCPTSTLVLEMVFKADGATIASAIAEGVQPRYNGPASDVKELESLIIEGVKDKGGQATKGTILRFDCSKEGVAVIIDGKEQGVARFEGIGSAFVDVFTDDKAVSPQLVDSCLDTWCDSGL